MLELFIILLVIVILFLSVSCSGISIVVYFEPCATGAQNIFQRMWDPFEGEIDPLINQMNIDINSGVDEMFKTLDSILSTVTNPFNW